MALRRCFLLHSNVPQTQPSIALANFPSSSESFPSQQFNKPRKIIELNCKNDAKIQQPALTNNVTATLSDLTFNRLQPTDNECLGLQSKSFGRFVAREAIVDEEYWTAAWLRAEAHWESVSYMRRVDSYKRKYAEEEFYALKQRCSAQDGNSSKCFCLVAVKKEDKNVRRTVINSIVGTLDLSVRQFMQGETYPGEMKRRFHVFGSLGPFDSHKYAYVSNLCVAKFARRQGIASNMLHLARDVAAKAGLERIFVHVNADNDAAQALYEKTGFKVFEGAASSSSSSSSPNRNNPRILMFMNL